MSDATDSCYAEAQARWGEVGEPLALKIKSDMMHEFISRQEADDDDVQLALLRILTEQQIRTLYAGRGEFAQISVPLVHAYCGELARAWKQVTGDDVGFVLEQVVPENGEQRTRKADPVKRVKPTSEEEVEALTREKIIPLVNRLKEVALSAHDDGLVAGGVNAAMSITLASLCVNSKPDGIPFRELVLRVLSIIVSNMAAAWVAEGGEPIGDIQISLRETRKAKTGEEGADDGLLA